MGLLRMLPTPFALSLSKGRLGMALRVDRLGMNDVSAMFPNACRAGVA
jgi:hypothetical protein